MKTIGIQAIEIYFPKNYCEQAELEKFNHVSAGKYTKGLGQHQLSFTYPFEDINSISLTVVSKLLNTHQIKPQQIGRLEIGTQTLIDKSKSTKTVLMKLFSNNHNIEGATSLNACYGATNALFNTLNWMQSPYWDGRYGIVVAADIAVYEKGPARITGGAGAVAILIGPNASITFQIPRTSFMDHEYDFFKPNPCTYLLYAVSMYPIVDGKKSINCYLNALKNCYLSLKQKYKEGNLLQRIDYYCFHSPFYKMVQKAYASLMRLEYGEISQKEIGDRFMKQVDPCMLLPQSIGNIYTGSLFSTLISLLMNQPTITNKRVMMFSYGSGLCSSMFIIQVHRNVLNTQHISHIQSCLHNRIKVTPEQYDGVMAQQQKQYGKRVGNLQIDYSKLDAGVYYLSKIDQHWHRHYQLCNSKIEMKKKTISALKNSPALRLANLQNHLQSPNRKFYQLPVQDRLKIISHQTQSPLNTEIINNNLNINIANSISENVIGTLSLPLSVVPEFIINNQTYCIPMCTQEPSVVAACSAIGKMIAPYSFFASSTPNVMIGQVHLPNSRPQQIHTILSKKMQIITKLNGLYSSMVQRGGGLLDIRIRRLEQSDPKQYSLDLIVNVCEAMGANIVNSLCQVMKQQLTKMGITTGIGILSNYCTERRAMGYFQIPVKIMNRKGMTGSQVAQKIMEAYDFACKDPYRASTHNKGIMNGIDSVCVATGQDWRAVEASCHTYACRDKQYKPLTHYQIVQSNGQKMFRGTLQVPISVGSIGGVINKNPIYAEAFKILGNPSAKTLSEIMVCIGLAQNFAALRALAVEGIQQGHMKLHARTMAKNMGVPDDRIDDLCEYMSYMQKYDKQIVLKFLTQKMNIDYKL